MTSGTNWYRAERIPPTRVEYRVELRWNGDGYAVNWNQVQQALNAAVGEYQDRHGMGLGEPPDNAVHVQSEDEAIVIWFDKPVAKNS